MKRKLLFTFTTLALLLASCGSAPASSSLLPSSSAEESSSSEPISSESILPSTSTTSESSSSESSSSIVKPSFDVEGSVSLNVGDTHKIVITNVVSLTEADFEFSSYNDNIATVDNDGVITAVNEGSTQILVRAKDVRKTVSVTVADPYKLHGVSLRKLNSIASLNKDEISFDRGDGGEVFNYAWGTQGGAAGIANKMDFENSFEDSKKAGRFSAVDGAFVANGDFNVFMNGNKTNITSDSDVHAMLYWKVHASERASELRLWGWSNQTDTKDSEASGQGMFRFMAYKLNDDGRTFETYVLKAANGGLGALSQDQNGWVSFSEVDDSVNGHIKDAPADNMFTYLVNTNDYDIRDKEVILTVEFQARANAKNYPDYFGVKRIGFGNIPEPDFSLKSSPSVSLYANETSQIELNFVQEASEGTITYISADETIATVSDAGLITACELDETDSTTISITNSKVPGKTLTVGVEVKPKPSTSFDLPTEPVVLSFGSTYQITPTNQVSCEKGFTYTSLEPNVLSVSPTGLVSTVACGAAKIQVTSNDLTKTMVVNVASTASLFNYANATLSAAPAFGTSGNYPWSFAWPATYGLADVAPTSDQSWSEAKVYNYVAPGQVTNIEGNQVQLIGNVGSRENGISNAMIVKAPLGEPNEFRLWGGLIGGFSDTVKMRVVAYVPNEDYSSFDVVILPFNGGSDLDAYKTMAHDDLSGFVTYTTKDQIGSFICFNIPSAIKNKIVFTSIEMVSVPGETHTRFGCTRFGYDVPNPSFSLKSSASVSLIPDQTSQIELNFEGGADQGTISYVSSNVEAATVSKEGLITGCNVAEETEAIITITNSKVPGKELKVTVTAKPKPATSFDLPTDPVAKSLGDTYQITPTNQVSCDAGFTFESMEPDILSVSALGLVSTIAVGAAKIKVTCNDLTKYLTINVNKTATVLGYSGSLLKDAPAFERSTGFPWDYAWGAGYGADTVAPTSDQSWSEAKVYNYVAPGQVTNIEAAASRVDLIGNVGSRTPGISNAMLVKAPISTPNEFRVWGSLNGGFSTTAKVRVVIYLPNADYSEFDVVVLTFNAGDGPLANLAHDDLSGFITYNQADCQSNFVNFVPPQSVQGKTAIISIEMASIPGDVQTRFGVRRFGFDA